MLQGRNKMLKINVCHIACALHCKCSAASPVGFCHMGGKGCHLVLVSGMCCHFNHGADQMDVLPVLSGMSLWPQWGRCGPPDVPVSVANNEGWSGTMLQGFGI